MPTLLAIETSCETASVALIRDGQVLVRESTGVQTHSQTVLPMVQQLLAEAQMPLGRCDAIAFGSGPGSFTGVRTACGITQGLAVGADLPVVPVVTLAAMAQACREEQGCTDVVAILDARMHEVYWAQYRYQGSWQQVLAPSLCEAAKVAPEGEVAACGNGLSAYAAAFAGRAFSALSRPDIMPHARQVAVLGVSAYLNGEAVAAHLAQPFYLRNRIALTTAERAAARETA